MKGRPRKNKVTEIEFQGKKCKAVEQEVHIQGGSGSAYVPSKWIGKRVITILMED